MMVPPFRGQDGYGRRVHLRTSGKSHVDAEKVGVSGKGLRSVRLRFYLETESGTYHARQFERGRPTFLNTGPSPGRELPSAGATWSGVGATAARTICEGFRAPPENMPKTGRRTDGLK
jgi:hypothetical protein